MKSDLDKLLLERAIEIRNNWKDVEKLKVFLEAWDTEFGHNHDDVVERVIGEYLEEVWAKKAEECGSNSLDDLLSILLDFPDGKYTKEEIERGYKVTTTFCPIAESFRAINRADMVPASIAFLIHTFAEGSMNESNIEKSAVGCKVMMLAFTSTLLMKTDKIQDVE